MSHAQSQPEPTLSRDDEPDRELTPGQALRQAWLWWFVLLVVPFLVFMGVLWTRTLGVAPTPRPMLADVFFVVSLVWMLLTVPGAFLLRNYCFRSYWEGRTVEPRSYVRGMLTIWLATEIGGLLALLGCAISGTWMPCLLPAALAFMLFTPFWPTGRAMVDPVGMAEDDEVFRHPR